MKLAEEEKEEKDGEMGIFYKPSETMKLNTTPLNEL